MLEGNAANIPETTVQRRGVKTIDELEAEAQTRQEAGLNFKWGCPYCNKVISDLSQFSPSEHWYRISIKGLNLASLNILTSQFPYFTLLKPSLESKQGSDDKPHIVCKDRMGQSPNKATKGPVKVFYETAGDESNDG
uniref:Uncharacterized protein n=1 Tax=Tetranychus urticae TaxID=32264 RepID=T1KQL3_TETUR